MTSPGVPNQQPVLPSFRTARQTRSNTLHQQAMTQPGVGSAVHGPAHNPANPTLGKKRTHDGTEVIEVPAAAKVPFTEQVIGYAQKTRGTLLRKPELKEHGEKILEGQITSGHGPDRPSPL